MKFRSVLFNFASCAGRNKKRADGSSAIFGRWLDGAEPVRSEHDVLRGLARTVLFPLLCVGFATLLLLAISHYAAWKFESMVFLIPVVVAAARWGVVSAMVGAIASVAVSDFLFIPPFYSFIIYDPQAVIDLLLFFFVALVTSNLAARLRNEVDASRRRESEIHNLYEFSHGLALSLTAGDLVEAMQSFLSVHLGCEAHLVGPQEDEDRGRGVDGSILPPRLLQEAREMIVAGERRSRLVTDADKQRLWILKSISTKMSDHGVLAVNLGNQPAQVTEELNRRIDALLAEASLVLTRIDAASALANASGRQRSDVLKTALIGTASHELHSPIAAILGSASVLDRVPALQADAKLRSLVQGMHHDAMRLDHDLQNILDGARIADNGIAPKFALMDPADTVAAAIKKRSHRIAFHRLKLDIEADLPLINVDSGLLEQALGQILENAAKYSPPNSEISIRARTEDRQVVLAISDQGVGLTDEEARELFNRHFAGGVTPT